MQDLVNQDLVNIGAPAFMELLSPQLTEKIVNTATLARYRDGQLIHSRGDDKPGISIVKTGSVNVGVYGKDGTFGMATILGPGQTFGEFTLFAGLPRTHDVTAIGATEIYQISAVRFTNLYEREPDISRAMLSASLMRLHLVLEMLDAIRRLPLRERTAKILVSMAQTTGNLNVFKCRQSDLAFTLGVSRVSLGKALKELSSLGLIEIGYGEIKMRDPGRLSGWVAAHDGADMNS